MDTILNTGILPYCKGCGHGLIAKNTARALENLGMAPLDVIVVTDIGCHGIIDGCLNTHTVHGLHGRSVALAAGIALGLDNPAKKIIVFIGDGGSTIGLQHILEAARLNLDMTVVVHNNMLYGMTGGQTSGLTARGFSTSTAPGGNPWAGYDICTIARASGAAYVSRITGIGDFSHPLEEAFTRKGFSLVEIMEICPGYGVRLNPGKKLSDILSSSERLPGRWETAREDFSLPLSQNTNDLMAELPVIVPDVASPVDRPVSLIMSGSAGEGVQMSAGIMARAAVSSGLHITQKGSYPVTVGVGFSTAELILSPVQVGYHGIEIPDEVIVTSADGLAHCRNHIGRMKKGRVFIDSSLPPPETAARVYSRDFRSAGARSASFFALLVFAAETGIVSTASVIKAAIDEGLDKKTDLARIREMVPC
jgi:2-oxoglutarate/2-oxoacid ferredoxin oxidoreductase subunit beta